MLSLFVVFIIIGAQISTIFGCFNCQCGISSNVKTYDGTDNTKILGGKRSNPAEWPFVVQIHNGIGLCTATIIGEQWILSAAHCNEDNSEITVIIGGKNYPTDRSIIHENYLSTQITNINDIMLVKLKQPIKYTRDITNVCLVRNVTAVNGDIAAVVGYGERFENVKNIDATQKEYLKLQDLNFKESSILHETPLMIRNMDFCKAPEAFATNRVCAGGEMQGTTRGDSGGPLLVVRNDRWVQYGITSYGSYKSVTKDVNKISDMGIYTKASAYCDWIENKTSGEIKCK